MCVSAFVCVSVVCAVLCETLSIGRSDKHFAAYIREEIRKAQRASCKVCDRLK